MERPSSGCFELDQNSPSLSASQAAAVGAGGVPSKIILSDGSLLNAAGAAGR
jgi:hypothetical protein